MCAQWFLSKVPAMRSQDGVDQVQQDQSDKRKYYTLPRIMSTNQLDDRSDLNLDQASSEIGPREVAAGRSQLSEPMS
jgi:hypothetical protein